MGHLKRVQKRGDARNADIQKKFARLIEQEQHEIEQNALCEQNEQAGDREGESAIGDVPAEICIVEQIDMIWILFLL